ncbi:1871_t:CDS:2, partial [Scutellospora calospora]
DFIISSMDEALSVTTYEEMASSVNEALSVSRRAVYEYLVLLEDGYGKEKAC